ncbi:hypothetical protein MKA58_09445 [[Clostridium] innocuum]|nr:hypothetical protein [[Clostridium] innocuum]
MMEDNIRSLLMQGTGLNATPFFSLGPYPAIAYKHTPISGGHVKQSQIEVRIIGDDYDELLTIKQKVLDILDQEEDASFCRMGDILYHSELAGGGDLFNDQIQMWECVSLFILTWRCI